MDINFLRFWHHKDSRGGSMHSSASFRFRNPLNTMGSAFVLQFGVNILAFDHERNVGVATSRSFFSIKKLDAPTLVFSVTGIHPKKVASKDVGFVSSDRSSNFNNDIFTIVRISRKKNFL